MILDSKQEESSGKLVVIAVLQISAALTFMNLRKPLLVCVNAKKEEMEAYERILRRISGAKEERWSSFDEVLGVDAIRKSFVVSPMPSSVLDFWSKGELGSPRLVSESTEKL
jgi:hypothetical protein